MAADKSHPCDVHAPTALGLWRAVFGYIPYLSVAHQISGRVRVKLNAANLDARTLRRIDAARLSDTPNAIPRGRSTSLALLPHSRIVDYDVAIIADADLADLQDGREAPEATVLVEMLQDDSRRAVVPMRSHPAAPFPVLRQVLRIALYDEYAGRSFCARVIQAFGPQPPFDATLRSRLHNGNTVTVLVCLLAGARLPG